MGLFRRHMRTGCVFVALTTWHSSVVTIDGQTRASVADPSVTDVATRYADGRRTVFEYITSYNDVTAAVTGSQTSDEIRMRKIDAFTAEAELSLAGRVVGQTRRVVSPDGMTMTITLRRDAPATVNNVTVYRRR